MSSAWRPTRALGRATAVGVVMLIAAAVGGRGDLAVLGVPLVALVVWALFTRPASAPTVSSRVSAEVAHEGDTLTWRVDVGLVPGLRDVVGHLPGDRWTTTTPEHGHVAAAASGPAGALTVPAGGAGAQRALGGAAARPRPGGRVRGLRRLRVDLAGAAHPERRDGAHAGAVHLACRASPPGGPGRPAPQHPGRRGHRARRGAAVPHRRPAAPHPLAGVAAHRDAARDHDLRRPGCRGAPRRRRHPRPRRA